MLYRLAILALELAAGCLLRLLVRRSAIMGPAPAWIRLYAAFFISVFFGAAGIAFFGSGAVFDRLPENLIAGCCFAEILAANTPANWARWRRFKKRLLGGNSGHFPGYYE